MELRAWLTFLRAAAVARRAVENEGERTSGLRLSEHFVLHVLKIGPAAGIRPAEIAAQTVLTRSGVTRALDRLEARGLVERRRCPEDGRGSLVVISARGRRYLLRAAPEHLRTIVRRFADHLTESEIDVLTRALDRVASENS
jgi:DNA-binding MarR family transcriptional regulator